MLTERSMLPLTGSKEPLSSHLDHVSRIPSSSGALHLGKNTARVNNNDLFWYAVARQDTNNHRKNIALVASADMRRRMCWPSCKPCLYGASPGGVVK